MLKFVKKFYSVLTNDKFTVALRGICLALFVVFVIFNISVGVIIVLSVEIIYDLLRAYMFYERKQVHALVSSLITIHMSTDSEEDKEMIRSTLLSKMNIVQKAIYEVRYKGM